MTVLQVADLRFGYAGDTLFQNVTFSLALGERAALVAPNGAGKSTLLRVIAGEIEPDQGSSVIRREATLGYYRQSHELQPFRGRARRLPLGLRRRGCAPRDAHAGPARRGRAATERPWTTWPT